MPKGAEPGRHVVRFGAGGVNTGKRAGNGDPDIKTITTREGSEPMLLEFYGVQRNSSRTS
jgi:hypothetical protein